MFEQRESGLFYNPSPTSEPKFICGPIEVLAITRSADSMKDYGLLIEWENIDKIKIRKLIPRRHIINDHGKLLKDLLVDSGLKISSWKGVWEHIFNYLNQSNTENRLTSSKKTGWLGNSFITPSWCVSRDINSVIYSGNKNSNFLSSKGSILDWQKEIGSLCINNPILAFTICTGLSAPLLHWLNWPSCGIHLFGKSKMSKTTILVLAASLYSDSNFCYTWRATDNGLEATAFEHNDLLLCLDELHQVSPEVVDQSIYTLANGKSKVRSNKALSQDDSKNWRLLYLSTGEIGLEEKLSPIQKGVKAGQEVRFLEVPIQRKFGVYDDLCGYKSMNDLSDFIWKAIKQNHGTIMPEWIDYLSDKDDLSGLLFSRVNQLKEEWKKRSNSSYGNQVVEASKRFALVGVAGEIAITAGLMPWPSGTAESSAYIAFNAWLEMRGSASDSEDEKLMKQIPLALKHWRRKLITEGTPLNDSYGYIVEINAQPVWFLTKEAFKKGLNITYKNQLPQVVKLMEEKGWMESNEGRPTYKRVIQGGSSGGRYFKVIPQKITTDLNLGEELSKPIFPY